MEWWHAALIVVAGMAAGFLNAVIGSGTLITFPTLLALGFPPLVANTSNTVGLVSGGFSAVLAGRADLVGQRRRLLILGIASLVGGTAGALLLLRLPPGVFAIAVPILIGLGCVLVLIQPVVSRRVAARGAVSAQAANAQDPNGQAPALAGGTAQRIGLVTWLAVAGAGVYGGYFGAAQGVLLMGILGLGVMESMARLNVVKNVLSLIVNGVAAAIFIVIAPIDWRIVAMVAVGSIVGAQIGGRIGRKLPPLAYRIAIVTVGVVAIGHQLWKAFHA